MVSNGLTLTLHLSKTYAFSIAPFTFKSSPSLSHNFCNNIVSITNAAKYLGLLMDDQLLSFKSHNKFLKEKLSCSLSIMTKLSY